MAKMYYNEQEAAQKLGVSPERLAAYVEEGKLKSYQDGARRMFKASEVDAMAGGSSGDSSEIDLAPADSVGGIELSATDTGEGVSLSSADSVAPSEGKGDTVITAEGISIFDDEELEVDAADPMAQTQVTPSLEDQATMEGAGSGSGLLDLTRESDDTSLGEVLDHIDMDEVSSDIDEQPSGQTQYAVPAGGAAAAPRYVEQVDAASAAFGGLLVGVAILMLLAGAVSLSMLSTIVPSFVQALRENLFALLGGAAVIAIAAAVIGYLTGKGSAQG